LKSGAFVLPSSIKKKAPGVVGHAFSSRGVKKERKKENTKGARALPKKKS
jgi:hypothetical protein